MKKSASLATRAFSTVSPKIAIGQGILRLEHLATIQDEAALEKFGSFKAADISVDNLPASLKELQTWYSLDKVSANDKYIPDPTAWQNMPFWEFVGHESKRAETWPFLVGFL